jgi:hypothetical protein
LIDQRLSHLVERKRVEIDRSVRILQHYFVDRRPRAPKRGQLLRIMLVGPHASPSHDFEDEETGDINRYELWAFVDHAAYRGLNRYWGPARAMLASELGGQASVTLSVFTPDEMVRAEADGNWFLTDKYRGGVILYEAALAEHAPSRSAAPAIEAPGEPEA